MQQSPRRILLDVSNADAAGWMVILAFAAAARGESVIHAVLPPRHTSPYTRPRLSLRPGPLVTTDLVRLWTIQSLAGVIAQAGVPLAWAAAFLASDAPVAQALRRYLGVLVYLAPCGTIEGAQDALEKNEDETVHEFMQLCLGLGSDSEHVFALFQELRSGRWQRINGTTVLAYLAKSVWAEARRLRAREEQSARMDQRLWRYQDDGEGQGDPEQDLIRAEDEDAEDKSVGQKRQALDQVSPRLNSAQRRILQRLQSGVTPAQAVRSVPAARMSDFQGLQRRARTQLRRIRRGR